MALVRGLSGWIFLNVLWIQLMNKTFHPVSLLFLPAALGIGLQIFQGAWDARAIALALLLLCLDQARMAGVDWLELAAVRSQLTATRSQTSDASEPSLSPDARLDRFAWVTLSTIAIELIGFYVAWQWLGFGVIIVLLSQLWFHGLAGIQLHPGEPEPIHDCGLGMRSPVLMADTVGILLVIFWLQAVAPLSMAVTLLAMVGLYGCVKYWPKGVSNASP